MTFSFPLFCSNSEPTSPHCYLINQTEKERLWVSVGGCPFSTEDSGVRQLCVNRHGSLAAGLAPQFLLTFSSPASPGSQKPARQGLPGVRATPNGEPPTWENGTVCLESDGIRMCPEDPQLQLDSCQVALGRSCPELTVLAGAVEINTFVINPNVRANRSCSRLERKLLGRRWRKWEERKLEVSAPGCTGAGNRN